MSQAQSELKISGFERSGFWSELWNKEDYWAIWIGLGIVVTGTVLFSYGESWRYVAVIPPRWTNGEELLQHFAGNWPRYGIQFAFWTIVFSGALAAMGRSVKSFVGSFTLLYGLSLAVFVIGQWEIANYYGFEAPLVALVLGLAIANLAPIPRSLESGFRAEFYIKTAIVLLGATLPFTLIIWAGPVAILQASIVSLATFGVIFALAVKLGLDKRLAATLGAGGAVCGVSAAIAVAGAVGAKREHAPIAITLVLLWAIVMIFVLPFVAAALSLPPAVGGAWIGTSEFADAAGIAAAQTYAGLVSGGDPAAAERAVLTFTLMKVIGRDVWIGIWCFVLAFVATTYWEKGALGRKARSAEIWQRFPKFVLGFLLASLLVTIVTRNYELSDFNRTVNPSFIAPIKDLRTWAFIFCFLSIGLTTQLRTLAVAGLKPFAAFSTGVAVNVALGLLLSAYVFGSYWANL